MRSYPQPRFSVPTDHQRLHFRRNPWAAGIGTTAGAIETSAPPFADTRREGYRVWQRARHPRIAKKLDLAETHEILSGWFRGRHADVTARFLRDVTWCYAPVRAIWPSAAIVLRLHTDRIL